MRMSGERSVRCADIRKEYLQGGGRKGGNDDPVHEYGVKHRSCLDALPYWQVIHDFCHSLILCYTTFIPKIFSIASHSIMAAKFQTKNNLYMLVVPCSSYTFKLCRESLKSLLVCMKECIRFSQADS